ncbi:MAG: peptide chain release factor N(5)-glutamine methyltransferase [Chloroflexi bacterium]|nr:peptide chain release factor N(5)-glutamine methyltransferase [Chloroflexota bacterium]
MPTVAEAIRTTTSKLLNAGITPDDAPIEARTILRHACGLTQEKLLAGHADQLSETAIQELDRLLIRRTTREPLAYILGEREFYGRTFRVDRRVLIPRPETETLIDLCTDFVEHNNVAQPKICDIGTGSGIIAITLAKQLPNANITAADIDVEALEIAKTNATHHSVNIQFAVEDATRTVARGDFDIIVSNPPYIQTHTLGDLQPEVRDWEPRQALDGGTDGMNILRPLIHSLPELLRKKGPTAAFIEIAPPVVAFCLEIARQSLPDAEIRIHRDFAGLERFLVILRD